MVLGNFSPENIIQLDQRRRSIEQLGKLGNVWIGPDVAVEKTIVIPPQELIQNVNIILSKKDLPVMDINRGAIGSLSWSVRSFLAQSGIEIMFHRNSLSDTTVKDINEGKNVLVPVDINNLGQRAVELDGNIMRFFWVNDRNRLRGANLVNAIKSGEFTVEGIEGEDWFLGGYEPDEKLKTTGEESNESLCVILRLKPQKFYIPYEKEPVRIKNSRKGLPDFLKPIPDGVKLDFEIGETPKVKLGENIVAVINLGAEHSQRHIYSPLIDPGCEGHIRTETLHGLPVVEFFLYRK